MEYLEKIRDSIEYNINKRIVPQITSNFDNKLKPIVKWPGDKKKVLKYILPNLPSHYNNYFEPFVGGGAVFTYIEAERFYINDKLKE